MDSLRIAVAALDLALLPPAPPAGAGEQGPFHPARSAWPWVGDDHHDGARTEEVMRLIEGRDRIQVLGGWNEPDDNGYNEIALVELDGSYFALTTSGCSCPLPEETWCLDFGPATLAELTTWVRKGPHAPELLPFLEDSPSTLRLACANREEQTVLARQLTILIDGMNPLYPLCILRLGDGSVCLQIEPTDALPAHLTTTAMAGEIWAEVRRRAAEAGVRLDVVPAPSLSHPPEPR